MNKKYKLGSKHDKLNLYRVVALRNFGNVTAGDTGGYVECEANLSHYDNCWVYGDARVSGNAWVYGDARVSGNAHVYGAVRVSGNAHVYGDARVYGNARVFGNTQVSGNAQVFGDAWIYGNAWVYGNARVFGGARVFGNTQVSDNAQVFGDALVYGNVRVCGDARVSEQQWIRYGHIICDLATDKKASLRAQLNITPFKNTVVVYKRVNGNLTSEYDSTFVYPSRGWVTEESAEESNISCASGLHFAGAEYSPQLEGETGCVILVAKVNLDDIITIQQGKIRCRRAFICGVAD